MHDLIEWGPFLQPVQGVNLIAVLINQHSLPLSLVQGITIMNTMKQQLCGDLVICSQVGAVQLRL